MEREYMDYNRVHKIRWNRIRSIGIFKYVRNRTFFSALGVLLGLLSINFYDMFEDNISVKLMFIIMLGTITILIPLYYLIYKTNDKLL